MGTDIEKLVDLMIQERMQSQFAKWREAETDKEKKALLNFIEYNKKTANSDYALNSLLVEYSGLEPLTSTLPVSRSSQMS